MAAVDSTVLNLLGKSVSFVSSLGDHKFHNKGIITNINFNIEGNHEICLTDGEYYLLKDILDFHICD